jgi:hypothetical protein
VKNFGLTYAFSSILVVSAVVADLLQVVLNS